MQQLRDKTAVVTGGAGGIGFALGERFASEGMNVVLADIEQGALDEAVQRMKARFPTVVGVQTDVTDAGSVEALADRARAEFGAVHVVCNNAGVAPYASILDTSLQDWRWLVEVNIMGVVHGVAVFGPIFVEQGEGHIVNTASGAGLLAAPGLGAYTATKHAVVGLSETLYYELAGTGVGISILCPGLVNTKILVSERNRPAQLGGSAIAYTEEQEGVQKMLAAEGAPPEQIAERVLQGIQNDELFILTHEDLRRPIEERYRSIVAGENPPIQRHAGLRPQR